MADDAVVVALIRESLMAAAADRQAAARLMLMAMRNQGSIDLSDTAMEVLRADEGAGVATEVQALATRLGIG